VSGPLKRLFATRGGLPGKLRAELEAEGLELVEERIAGTITYRGYIAPGQRPASGRQSTLAALALTQKRLVIRGTGNFVLDAPPGTVTATLEDGALKLAYAAEDIYPMSRSGSVELLLRTPRAAEIHATLEAWTRTRSS
jgi:hypothetical protein